MSTFSPQDDILSDCTYSDSLFAVILDRLVDIFQTCTMVSLPSPGRQGSYSLGTSPLCARWPIRMLPQQIKKQAQEQSWQLLGSPPSTLTWTLAILFSQLPQRCSVRSIYTLLTNFVQPGSQDFSSVKR